jgi:peptidoglycan hydrolase CwlO-like protein
VIILSVISIILSLASFITIVAVKINYNLETVSLLSIIGFIGILATFVVVSNFSQVNRIESKMETKISELNKAVSKLLIIEEDIKQIRIEIDKINSKIEKEQENVVAIGEKIKTNGLNKQVYNLAKSIQKWTETAQNIQKWAELGQNIQESS